LSEDISPGGTYKTLDEQREVLSPAEERFERRRRTIGLFLGPLVLPLGLPYTQQSLATVYGASYGFMLPVSTPPNAIVYGSGMIPITKMIRSGIVFDVIGVVLITFGVTVMSRLVGLA
jgi:hypothetical protein